MANNWNSILSNTNNLRDVLVVLQKVLSLLDNKVDLTVVNEALENIDGMSAELQQAINDLLNNDFMEPFATEEELLKSTPILEKKAAKALDTRKVFLWSDGAWHDTGLSDKDLAIAHSDAEIAKTNLNVSTKLDVSYDFFSYQLLPSFIQINEDGKIIEIKEPEKVELYLLDFFNYDLNPALILINDFGQILNETDKSFLYDFFTYDLNPTILSIDTNNKVIDFGTSSESQDINFDNLPNSEAIAEDLYFYDDVLKRVRKYPPIYNQTNDQLIPLNKADNVYEFFDQLMAENPTYITKTQFGVSTLGVPMYTYKFAAPARRLGNGSTQAQISPPIIMINAGIHGSERYGIIAVMCFAYNLVNNWRDLDMYDELRMHCELHISPLMNIDATNKNWRVNANGVDCNRNFDQAWETGGSTDPASQNYKGTAPFSEVESRNYRDLVNSIECDAYLDIHHGGEKEILWLASNLPENLRLLSNVATDVTAYFHKNINPNVDPNTRLVYLPKNGDGTACGWMCSQNKSGFLMEGIGYSNEYIGTLFNARKFNEWALTRLIYKAFKRTKIKQELSI